MIFLQGSPELEEVFGIKTGRLSGIVAHHIPKYLQKKQASKLGNQRYGRLGSQSG